MTRTARDEGGQRPRCAIRRRTEHHSAGWRGPDPDMRRDRARNPAFPLYDNEAGIPQVARCLTARSPDFGRLTSFSRPEWCLRSRKRLASGGSSR
jgi:hypothetical protein